jgi:hypothetical protein
VDLGEGVAVELLEAFGVSERFLEGGGGAVVGVVDQGAVQGGDADAAAVSDVLFGEGAGPMYAEAGLLAAPRWGDNVDGSGVLAAQPKRQRRSVADPAAGGQSGGHAAPFERELRVPDREDPAVLGKQAPGGDTTVDSARS